MRFKLILAVVCSVLFGAGGWFVSVQAHSIDIKPAVDGDYRVLSIQPAYKPSGEPIYFIIGEKMKKTYFADLQVRGFVHTDTAVVFWIPQAYVQHDARAPIPMNISAQNAYYRIEVSGGKGTIFDKQ